MSQALKASATIIFVTTFMVFVAAVAPPSDAVAGKIHRVGKDAQTIPPAGPCVDTNARNGSKIVRYAHMPTRVMELNQAGRYDEAVCWAERYAEETKARYGVDAPQYAWALFGLGKPLQNINRFAEAEPLYRRALRILEKVHGVEHPEVAVVLSDLGVLLLSANRREDAEPLLRRALDIGEKSLPPDHPEIATRLNNLAQLIKDAGRLAEAEELYGRALLIDEKSLGPDHPNVGSDLNNLAALLQATGRPTDAIPLARRALAIDEKSFGSNHPNYAFRLHNLGELLRQAGSLTEAERFFRDSIAINVKSLGPDHPNVASNLNSLALVLQGTNRPTEAEQLFRRVLSIDEKSFRPDHPEVALHLNNLAELYSHQGRYASALPLVQTTIERGRAMPSVALPVLFAAQGSGLMPDGKAQDDALSVAQRASESAAAAAVNKLGTRLAAGSGRLASLVRNDQDLAVETETLDKAILAAFSKAPANRDAAAEQHIRDRLTEIAKQRTALQGVFAAEFPDYAALSNPPPLAVKEIQVLLHGGEALLLYAAGEEESYVFAVTRESTAWKPITLGTAVLSERVAAFRRGLDVEALQQSAEGGKPVLFDLGLANELYAALIGPVEEVIKDVSHLLVVPAGPLTSLPFHLLVTEKPSTAIPQPDDVGSYRDAAWLIRRQAVSVLPALASLRALRRVAGRDPGDKPLVGFGDPVFDPALRAKVLAVYRGAPIRAAVTRGYKYFWHGESIDQAKLARHLAALPDTADELKAVRENLGAAAGDLHLGSDATETTVKGTALADYRVVYFATHALVAGPIAGGEPSLALTLPKQPTEFDDGLLTASEVAQLKLNADWVVLSACNTAAADKPGAEALSGLARAFFYAGARALLVSHWSVESKAATRLTTSTFAIMKADPKLGRAEALRNAMLAYMNDRSSPRNAHPAYWGPFSIVGEGAARGDRLTGNSAGAAENNR